MAVDHDVLVEHLTRLQLTCIRDQLDSLLDEAGEKQLTLREAVAFLVGREVSRKERAAAGDGDEDRPFPAGARARRLRLQGAAERGHPLTGAHHLAKLRHEAGASLRGLSTDSRGTGDRTGAASFREDAKIPSLTTPRGAPTG